MKPPEDTMEKIVRRYPISDIAEAQAAIGIIAGILTPLGHTSVSADHIPVGARHALHDIYNLIGELGVR